MLAATAGEPASTCLPGWREIPNALGGSGHHVISGRARAMTIQECADSCKSRSGCAAFEYHTSVTCGVYSEGIGNIQDQPQRSGWRTCVDAPAHFQCSDVKRTILPQRIYGRQGACRVAPSRSRCYLESYGGEPLGERCPLSLQSETLRRVGLDGVFVPDTEKRDYDSCAAVSSAGSMTGTGCGSDIDAQ
jgi:hypothetical protein